MDDGVPEETVSDARGGRVGGRAPGLGARAVLGWCVLTGCSGLARPPVMFVDGQPSRSSSADGAASLAAAPCRVDDVMRVPPRPGLHGLPPSGPTYDYRVAPGRQVEALSDAAQVAVAPGAGCASTRGGRVACWSFTDVISGDGVGFRSLHRRAEPVPGLVNIASVALGRARACALSDHGDVACWDTGDVHKAAAPQRIDGIHDARSLSMMPSSDVACAVTARHTLACWGPAAASLPEFPSGWSLERAIEHTSLVDVLGVALSQRHYCVLQAGGRVRCFGFGSDVSSVIEGAHQIVATDGATCAITQTRGVACWGDPALVAGGEQLATTAFVERPREVAGLGPVAALSAGTDSICALLSDGTARCWGRNATGGLGDGTLENRFAPMAVCNARGIVQLAPGPESCAVFGDGSVRCWGDLEAVEYD